MDLDTVVALVRELSLPQTLEELLARVVNRAAAIARTERASLRLLDASRTRLLVGCRAGAPLHENYAYEFKLGEGLIGWVAEKATTLRTGRATEDPRYVARADMKDPLHSFLGVPILYGGKCIGVLSLVGREPDRFGPEDEKLITILAGLSAPHLEIARLVRLQRIDPKTGVLTRDAFDDTLPEELTHLGGPMSVAVVDVDGFRSVNARHGQSGGDEVLRAVGQTLAATLRVGDAVVRYGADEFILVLTGVGLTPASRIVERLRRAVSNIELRLVTGQTSVTVSIGVAERRTGERRTDLLRRVRVALDGARAAGGDRVQISPG